MAGRGKNGGLGGGGGAPLLGVTQFDLPLSTDKLYKFSEFSENSEVTTLYINFEVYHFSKVCL